MRADARGMGRYVRPLLRELARRDDVHLTLLVRDPSAAADERAIVGACVDVAGPAEAARSARFDAVWYPWNGMRFGTRAPAIVTINDDFAFAYPAADIVGRWREQTPIRRAARRATRLLTISQWSRDALSARFALTRERIDVLPLRPDPSFSPGVEASPFAEPFILTVGAGEVRKNVAFLVEAVAAAFSGGVRLVIVGTPEPPLRARLERYGLPLSVLRGIDDDVLRRLYRTAAAVAVPSLAEGFGLVAAEAQACGAAVVVSAASALPETVGDAAIALAPHDARAWQHALRALVDDAALRADYGARAAARWAAPLREEPLRTLLASVERARDDRR